jgi:hypothetical protein
VSDPIVVAARELLADSLDSMRATVAAADRADLNRRPAGEDTNSIAVLTVHAMHSTRSWLSCAMGAPLPERDRPSEFTVDIDQPELLAFFDEMAGECSERLAIEDPFEPGALRERHPRSDGSPTEKVTSAWALLHALEHLREHVAHLELTAQIFASAGG